MVGDLLIEYLVNILKQLFGSTCFMQFQWRWLNVTKRFELSSMGKCSNIFVLYQLTADRNVHESLG